MRTAIRRSRAAAASAPSAPGVPPSLSPSEPSSWTARMRPLVAQTFETSSIATRASSVPVPVPPHSSSKRRPKISCSRKSSTTSQGNSCEASISAARGAIRSRARSRTSSRISRCSSLRASNGTARFYGEARAFALSENLAQELVRGVGLALRRRLQVGDDGCVGDGVVERDHDSGEVGGLAQPLGGRHLEPGLQVRVEQRLPLRPVRLPVQREQVDEGMGDASVGPVEVLELAVDAGDVAEVQVAVDERRRDAARGEPAADLLERRRQPAQLGRPRRRPAGGWRPGRSAAARSASRARRAGGRDSRRRGARRSTRLVRSCSPAKRRSASCHDSSGDVAVEQLLERRQQHPAVLAARPRAAPARSPGIAAPTCWVTTASSTKRGSRSGTLK